MADRNQTERLGVNAVEAIFLQMGWIFREQTVSDYGIDAHAEPREEGAPTGQLIALQIKTGESYFRKRGNNFVFYGERKHLDYWRRHVLPVFIILHNPATGQTVWQRVEPDLVKERGEGRWSIEIPTDQVLNDAAGDYLRRGISSDPRSVRRVRMLLDLPLMREIMEKQEEDSVFLTVDEWVNKTLNFRKSALFYGDPHGEAVYEFDRWVPFSNLGHFMNESFPWLDFEYAEPIDEGSIEVEGHILEVKVNSLGRAFLEVEEYMENGSVPLDVERWYDRSSDSYAEDDRD
ncbi:hypothetical protein FHX15_003669 [Rhizobium sp. BK650]|uniref:DUF4365 domain-containing protein n=1 Tax=Rhizobium sp. BK650 TaxID=2586990 RepID=UPI00161F7491|nr:DUF4365 domain-containing protein [Rhizobium sp. BK650]MBB3658422.1 hypothetical protein [Rhizobium sp. BK650]